MIKQIPQPQIARLQSSIKIRGRSTGKEEEKNKHILMTSGSMSL